MGLHFTIGLGSVLLALAAMLIMWRQQGRWMQRCLDVRSAALRQERDTALERAARAERASASRGAFLANMSHEIRTPLNSMIGTTELLLDGDLTRYQKAQLHTVMHSAETLLRIINDILDFSKIESGRLMLEFAPFSLAALLYEVAEMFAPRVRARSQQRLLEIIVDVAPGLPPMIGDAARIRQILVNLTSNAMKFTRAGYVRLHAHPLPTVEGVRLQVVDTGIGIAADKCEMIFDKFAQAEGTATTRQFGGTGLGLSICRELAALMGGRLAVESRPGEGSCFTADIPLQVATGEEVAELVLARPGARLDGRRALIVDPLAPAAELLRRLLADAGLRCFLCDDMEAARDTLRGARETGLPMDYIFVEERLAGGSAMPFLHALLESEAGTGSRTIALSMFDDAYMLRNLSDVGCHGFLRKPVMPQQLYELLARLEAGGTTRSFVDGRQLSGPAEEAPQQGYPDYSAHAVLLVEDNRINRELACEMLTKFGIAADVAENGMEAIDAALSRPYRLILMDCQMPVMDGFESSRQLRRLMMAEEIAPAPIIALTANAMKGDRERCLEAGMSDYLCKPLRLQEMKCMLARWLMREPQRQTGENAA